MTKVLGLIQLIESTQVYFYEHVAFAEGVLELQWMDQCWRYRKTINEGEWSYCESPILIEEIHLAHLELHLRNWLAEAYVFSQVTGEEETFQTKRIAKALGEEHCQRALRQHQEFSKALIEVIQSLLGEDSKAIKLV